MSHTIESRALDPRSTGDVAAPVAAPSVPPRRFPFTVGEELFVVEGSPEGPSNMEFEIRFAGSLDESRLRSALESAVAAHPMLRARQVSSRFLVRPPCWEIAGVDEARPTLEVSGLDEGGDIDAVRAEFSNRFIDLASPPGLRMRLVRRPGGDSLLLSIHHSLTDGIGVIRLFNSMARAYSGRPDPVPEVDPLEVRNTWSYFRRRGPAPASPRPRRGEVARVAPDGATEAPGFGIRGMALDAEECVGLAPKRFGPEVSLNDLLVAALHRTIARWNADRGRESDLIAVTVPINLRPKDWRFEVVSNVIYFERIVSDPGDRASPRSLIAAVSAQSRPFRGGVEFARFLTYPRWLFWFLTQAVLPVLVVLRRRFPDREKARSSMLLSNLGRIETKLSDFGPGPGAIAEFSTSPPVAKSMGVAIVISISHGRLLFSMRHRLSHMDGAAARAFLDLYREELRTLNRAEA